MYMYAHCVDIMIISWEKEEKKINFSLRKRRELWEGEGKRKTLMEMTKLNPSSRVNELKSPPRVEILPHWKVNETVRTTEGEQRCINIINSTLGSFWKSIVEGCYYTDVIRIKLFFLKALLLSGIDISWERSNSSQFVDFFFQLENSFFLLIRNFWIFRLFCTFWKGFLFTFKWSNFIFLLLILILWVRIVFSLRTEEKNDFMRDRKSRDKSIGRVVKSHSHDYAFNTYAHLVRASYIYFQWEFLVNPWIVWHFFCVEGWNFVRGRNEKREIIEVIFNKFRLIASIVVIWLLWINYRVQKKVSNHLFKIELWKKKIILIVTIG